MPVRVRTVMNSRGSIRQVTQAPKARSRHVAFLHYERGRQLIIFHGGSK